MKIFGIGLSRTGTTSLASALRILGYRAIHFPASIQDIEQSDAATDTTVACGYAFLDVMYPGSKFIYTARDMESWLGSCERYFADRPANTFTRKLRLHLYGQETFSRPGFEAARLEHERKVRAYFTNRPDDFLWMDVSAGWPRLCEFLERPVPGLPYPHVNASTPLDMK